MGKKLTDTEVQNILLKMVTLISKDGLSINSVEFETLADIFVKDGQNPKIAAKSRKNRQRYMNLIYCIYHSNQEPLIKKTSIKPMKLKFKNTNLKNLYNSNSEFAEMDFILRYKINALKHPGGINNTCISIGSSESTTHNTEIARLKKTLSKLYVSYMGSDIPEDLKNQDVFDTLQYAIGYNKIIKIRHHHFNEAVNIKTAYTIRPLKLFIERGYWYLAAAVLEFGSQDQVVHNKFSDKRSVEQCIESFKIANLEVIEGNLPDTRNELFNNTIKEIIQKDAFTSHPYYKRYTAYLECHGENIFNYFKRKKYAPSQKELGNWMEYKFVVSFNFACYHEFKIIFFPWLSYLSLVGIEDEGQESEDAYERTLGKIENDLREVIVMHKKIHQNFDPCSDSSKLQHDLIQHPSCR